MRKFSIYLYQYPSKYIYLTISLSQNKKQQQTRPCEFQVSVPCFVTQLIHRESLFGLCSQRASPRPDIILSTVTPITLISPSMEELLARSTNGSSDSAQQILLYLSWKLAHVTVCWVLAVIVILQWYGILPDRPQHPFSKICWIMWFNTQQHLQCLWLEMFLYSVLFSLNDYSLNSIFVWITVQCKLNRNV